MSSNHYIISNTNSNSLNLYDKDFEESGLRYSINFTDSKVKIKISTAFPHGCKFIGPYKSHEDYTYSYSDGTININCDYSLDKIIRIFKELDFTIPTGWIEMKINTNKKNNIEVIKHILKFDWFYKIQIGSNCMEQFEFPQSFSSIKEIVILNKKLYERQMQIIGC